MLAGGQVGAPVVVRRTPGGAAEAAARGEGRRVLAERVLSGPLVLGQGATVVGVLAGGEPGEEQRGVGQAGGGEPQAEGGEPGGAGARCVGRG